jgi:hypothetical protein
MDDKPEIPQEKDEVLYQIIADRRVGTDTMMWQAPVLSLTAQAFLLTIALGPDSAPTARAISALLAVLAAAASLQLMAKHRYYEVSDSKWLERYEGKHLGCPPLHTPKRPGADPMKWYERLPSYYVWCAILGIFGIAGLVVIVLTICCPECLEARG